MAAQLIHDRVVMECLEGVWETLEGNERCRFRGTIRLTATSLVHPEEPTRTCLLYTSDAADDSLRVDLGGRRIIKKQDQASITRPLAEARTIGRRATTP